MKTIKIHTTPQSQQFFFKDALSQPQLVDHHVPYYVQKYSGWTDIVTHMRLKQLSWASLKLTAGNLPVDTGNILTLISSISSMRD